jgi:transcriptional regulator with XRE-family HTH domain
MTRRFDVAAFWTALDITRAARSAKWSTIATETGVSPALLTRLKQGHAPAADGLVALARWSGLNLVSFLADDSDVTKPELPEPLTVALVALSSDSRLTPQALAAVSAVLTTTYQQLADARIGS